MTKKRIKLDTIQEAKDYSLKKWNPILTNYARVLSAGEQNCGFCLLQEIDKGCNGCLVRDKCKELDEQFFDFAQVALDYLTNDLIPFIENFEGEKKK